MATTSCWILLYLVLASFGQYCMASQIGLGSRLLAREDRAWMSDNGTFAFGFTPEDGRDDQFQIAVWFAELPGDRVTVWSAR